MFSPVIVEGQRTLTKNIKQNNADDPVHVHCEWQKQKEGTKMLTENSSFYQRTYDKRWCNIRHLSQWMHFYISLCVQSLYGAKVNKGYWQLVEPVLIMFESNEKWLVSKIKYKKEKK